jgi:hypothetical protein
MTDSANKYPADGIEGDLGLALALAAGMKPSKAADRFDVSQATVYRRLRDPAFQQAVKEARDALLSEATGQLASAAVAAVMTLRGLLTAKSPMVQLGAARTILEHTLRYSGDFEAINRVQNMERRTGAADGAKDAA